MTAGPGLTDIDALIAELAENDGERELMGRAAQLLAYAADEVAPSASLKDRVLARVAQDTGGPQFLAEDSFFAHTSEMEWLPLAPGVEVKVLYQEPGTQARTVLVRMAPNVPFPPHPHGFIEDLYLVTGEAWVGDVPMRTGDYCRAPAGTEHNHVRSGDAGALAVVVSR